MNNRAQRQNDEDTLSADGRDALAAAWTLDDLQESDDLRSVWQAMAGSDDDARRYA